MPKSKADPAKGKEEGGPLERERAFVRQRGAVLRPREDSEAETATPGSPAGPRPDVIREYRKRQKAGHSKKPS